MPNISRLSKDEQERTIIVMRKAGSLTAAAALLGIARSTLRGRLASLGLDRDGKPLDAGFEVSKPLDGEPTASEIIARRVAEFGKRDAAHKSAKLIQVKIKKSGPIGIAHFGDPHVDDNGCDWPKLNADVATVKATEGMFGGNVGDLQNNWIGRLARLYGNQSTSAQESWRLVEWLCKEIPWLYLIGGNHDGWSGNGDPLHWIMRQAEGVFQYHGARLNLNFPNGRAVRINARHDFTGHSMWNPAHGPMKAAQGGWRDHILTCGHKHTSFVAGPMKDPSSGLLTWAIRCGGYKVHDEYAAEKGLPDQNAFAACVTIIDPQFGDDDPRLVTVIPDVQEGAEFLAWKRQRAA